MLSAFLASVRPSVGGRPAARLPRGWHLALPGASTEAGKPHADRQTQAGRRDGWTGIGARWMDGRTGGWTEAEREGGSGGWGGG